MPELRCRRALVVSDGVKHDLLEAHGSYSAPGLSVHWGGTTTPLLGLKLGLADGLEVHGLCLTIGLDPCPPAVKTPFGRLGFSE